MAHSITHGHDFTVEEALSAIKSERTRRSWTAVILFGLSAAAVVATFYFSYRDVPAPASPANAQPALLEPYR